MNMKSKIKFLLKPFNYKFVKFGLFLFGTLLLNTITALISHFYLDLKFFTVYIGIVLNHIVLVYIFEQF